MLCPAVVWESPSAEGLEGNPSLFLVQIHFLFGQISFLFSHGFVLPTLNSTKTTIQTVINCLLCTPSGTYLTSGVIPVAPWDLTGQKVLINFPEQQLW